MTDERKTTTQLRRELREARERIVELEGELRRDSESRWPPVASTEHLRLLADNVKDILWVLQLPELRFSYLSPSVEQLMGYTIEEGLALEFDALYSPEDLATVQGAIVEELTRDGEPGVDPARKRTIQVDQIHADGSKMPVEIVASLVRDAQGRPEAILGVTRDITDRYVAERALRESEARLAEAQRIAHIGCWELNLRSNRLWWSDEIFRIFEMDKDHFGASYEAFLETIHPDDRELVNGAYVESVKRKTPYDIVHRLLLEDGRVKHVQERCETHYNADGVPLRSIGTVQDITETTRAEEDKNKLEEQLRQSQKMEAIGRLAGGVAHDFNNMLCVIKGNAVLALDDLTDGDPLRESIEEITTAAQRAADLTSQLLAFSRKQVIEPRVINLSHLIDKLHPMLVRVIGEDVILRTVAQKRLGRVRADPGQMEQIVLNLAINARDAMPDGGELLIETADVVLDDDYCGTHAKATPGTYVMLAVSDTGCGMSAEIRPKIFEPFFTTKQLGQGTGLGLATVFGIVEQSGGRIEVYSELGEGSTFKVYLPRVLDKAEVLRSSKAPVHSGGSETVLLVEDDDILRGMAGRVLTRAGYQVLSAGSGDAALGAAQNHDGPIHLLLTDVVMPHMNGRELADKLVAMRPELRVLYTSGYTHNVIAHHGVLDEGVQFVAKPYSPESLATRVREVLDAPGGDA